jgi:hypothetical protein
VTPAAESLLSEIADLGRTGVITWQMRAAYADLSPAAQKALASKVRNMLGDTGLAELIRELQPGEDADDPAFHQPARNGKSVAELRGRFPGEVGRSVAPNPTPVKVREETPAPTPPPPSPFPLIRVRDIDPIYEQQWLVKNLIPRFANDGTAGYIFGPPKARKSLMLADLALSVTTGTGAIGGAYPVEHTGAAVGFFAEDPRAETSRRIHRMALARNVEVPENLYLFDVPALALDDLSHQGRIIATLSSVPDLALVWLDPMVRLHRANDNRAEELAPIHTYLRTLARTFPHAVVILAHHAGKTSDFRGSTDYPAFGDFNLYSRTADEQTTEIHKIENRGGPPGAPFRFTVMDGSCEAGPTMSLVYATVDKAKASKEDAIMESVRAWASTNPDGSGQACQAHVKQLGLKIKAQDFWNLWRDRRSFVPRTPSGGMDE